ncbi:MAG: hypothetical protein S4CHLAM6_08390 [Chlamydiae bacterium]|nr:hypothetical protein [Chlamydiota bacterium]
MTTPTLTNTSLPIISFLPFKEGLRTIKDHGYSYTLEKIVDFILGNNRSIAPYTRDECKRLLQDAKNIHGDYDKTCKNYSGKTPIAYMTAGAPGAGKTTLVLEMIKQGYIAKGIPYVDPDDALKKMHSTYSQSISKDLGPEPRTANQEAHCRWASTKAKQLSEAYKMWQAGSNAIVHTYLPTAVKLKKSHIFGTTATSETAGPYLDLLKQNGFQTHMIYVSAPDAVRWESIKLRDKNCVQTTEEDIRVKGIKLPLQTQTYFTHADVIDFYWRSKVQSAPQHVATWLREPKRTQRSPSNSQH